MGRINWKERIVIDPGLYHGEPCIKGTRIPVAMIVGSLADGMPAEELLETYPQLTLADIQAALAYAADVLHQEIMLPFAG
ncbi:MAG: DUF433 domain-containing protein [Chloroflexi bacterium]|nr:DUF433 domain-containing protein [Chloroflexota bacterium]MCI0577960.1 DUF433 domain-containing protein [Chloroflexota bacterium]MCI0647762.1 DUF433 domain-containing protein [Chloroflexota bacterium]